MSLHNAFIVFCETITDVKDHQSGVVIIVLDKLMLIYL